MFTKHINHTLGISPITEPFLSAKWNAPAHIKTLISTRNGGVSQAPFHSLNLGTHVGDDAQHVAINRAIVQAQVNVPIAYLNQVHGINVVQASEALQQTLNADASINADGTAACAVMTADCLPILFCDQAGTIVAAAHAGWRGLAYGIIEQTLASMNVPPAHILAYLGPAIGPDAFEVGEDVKTAFENRLPQTQQAFKPLPQAGKYLADIYTLARLTLQHAGVPAQHISGGEHCTVLERNTFFSYRRNTQTGRMISAIWIDRSINNE